MAILKHLAIKKKDYSDIQQYLIFKCEEGTHKPLRDETGHMIQRDFFIQSGMNCNATARFSNLQFENPRFRPWRN